MKKNIYILRLFSIISVTLLSFQLSKAFAQDTLYIYQGGSVVEKRAVLQIDSVTFAKPITPASACGAYIAPNVWKAFMCHNLGADTSLDPMAYSEGINGDLYQWGRETDGHEKRNSLSTTTWATSNTPGHSLFINNTAKPYDWREGGGNDDRWANGSKGANDPCPAGFKVPSQAEWAGVVSNNTKGGWANGYKFGSNLFLPASGTRFMQGGALTEVNSGGYYWSSTVFENGAYRLRFLSGGYTEITLKNARINLFSVRCIAE